MLTAVTVLNHLMHGIFLVWTCGFHLLVFHTDVRHWLQGRRGFSSSALTGLTSDLSNRYVWKRCECISLNPHGSGPNLRSALSVARQRRIASSYRTYWLAKMYPRSCTKSYIGMWAVERRDRFFRQEYAAHVGVCWFVCWCSEIEC